MQNAVRGTFIFLLLAIFPCVVLAQRPRITAPIDDNVRVTIAHSHPLQAQPRFDRGPLDGTTEMKRMMLLMSMSAEQQHDLQTLLDAQQTKGSPDYRRWLTPEQFALRFGPSPSDLIQAQQWLQQRGFQVDAVARGGMWIEFSGTAAQVNAAFDTQVRRYFVGGKMHVANASDISLPTALAPAVRGVASLHDFFRQPMLTKPVKVKRTSDGMYTPVDPGIILTDGVNVFNALAPGDYAKIYDLNPLYRNGTDGTGQTIAIVARSNIDPGDITDFQFQFGLPFNPPNIILNGPDPGLLFIDDAFEATLDTEWSGAVAPRAKIDVVVSSSTVTSDGADLSAAYIVDNNLAPVMSMSFGLCEAFLGSSGNSFYNSLWQQAAAQGISVFVSSGDNGAAGCDDPNFGPATGGLAVSGIATTPYNTAVGGTQFNEGNATGTFWTGSSGANFVNAVGYIPEAVWNESCDPAVGGAVCAAAGNVNELFAGSGGASTIYSKPTWQTGTGVPNDGKRDIPDVSLTAAALHDPYVICFFRFCTLTEFFTVGGTSASSPSFAGIMALINQATGGRQGLANYVLYQLAATQNPSNCNSSNRTNPAVATTCIFNDVTAGNNGVPGQSGFTAGTGYDRAIGLGSVNAANLVNAWVTATGSFKGTATALTSGTTSVQHGQAISFTATVSPLVGTGTPTGTVALVTNLAGPSGPPSLVSVGSGALSGGTFTGSFSNLPGGSYNVTAHYPGDGTYAASDSNSIAVTITKENSSTTLSSFVADPNGFLISGTTSAYGDFMDLHTEVTPASGNGAATGQITFLDSGNPIGSVPLNSNGQADLFDCFNPTQSNICLTAGTHTISVSYPGDVSFNPSSSSPAISITITKGTPFVAMPQFPETVNIENSMSVDVLVWNTGSAPATGTVQLLDGGVPVGSPITLNAGIPSDALVFVGQLSQGTHNYTAQYSGDSNYNSNTATGQMLVVAPFQWAASPTRSVRAGGTTNFPISVNLTNYAGVINFTCTAPANTTCSVQFPALAFNYNAASANNSVTVTTSTSAKLDPPFPRGASVVLAFVGGFLVLGFSKRRWRRQLSLLLLLLLVGAFGACGGGGGGGGGGGTTIPPTNATITVTASDGTYTTSTNLQLSITH